MANHLSDIANTHEGVFSPLIAPYQLDGPIDWDKHFNTASVPLYVEIGFGLGEYLLKLLKENPAAHIIGFEQNWERLYKTLQKVHASGAGQRARVLKVDAHIAFERLFQPKSVDRVYCLFPCPWHKDRHERHRLFSKDFLKLLNNRLKEKGSVRLVTDSKPYYDWVLGQISSTGFEVRKGIAAERFHTKFERKWIEGGQREFFELNMVKRNHMAFSERKKKEVKAYQIKTFDPSAFRFQDEKKKASVIFKDMVFDPRKEKALVHLLVAEEHLTQYVWVDIKKRDGEWRISKSDGQNIYLTPGVARAVELVYQAAKGS